jgi:hypothetical protein
MKIDCIDRNRQAALETTEKIYGPVSMDELEQDRLIAASRAPREAANPEVQRWLVEPTAEKAGKKLIFDNPYVTGLVIEWKKNRDLHTYTKIVEASNNLMDSIIRKRKFHLSAPFDDIKGFIYLQFANWLDKFDPTKQTTLYTYISACSRNAAIAYVKKEQNLRDRIKYTDVPMEAFNTSYSENFDTETRGMIMDAVREIQCRWKEPQVREAIRYVIRTIVASRTDKKPVVLRCLQIGFDIDAETCKFLYEWSQAALRVAVLEHYDQPMGQIDLLRSQEKFSFLPDIVNLIGMPNTVKLMNAFPGQTIKFPSQTQVHRVTGPSSFLGVNEDIDDDPTPDNIERIAKRLGTSPRAIEEYYDRTTTNVIDGVLEDHPVYDLDD